MNAISKFLSMSRTTQVLVAIAATYAIASVIPSSPPPQPKPAPVVQAPKPHVRTPLEEAQGKAYLARLRVKSILRNPDSAIFENVYGNDDASLVCIVVRAQNGFGGMTKDFFVVRGAKVTQNNWNALCAGKSYTDYSY